MTKLPKLKVSMPWNATEGTCDLEQARHLLFSREANLLVIVEGQTVNSYFELAQLATQERYQDKESLEVVVVPFLVAGG